MSNNPLSYCLASKSSLVRTPSSPQGPRCILAATSAPQAAKCVIRTIPVTCASRMRTETTHSLGTECVEALTVENVQALTGTMALHSTSLRSALKVASVPTLLNATLVHRDRSLTTGFVFSNAQIDSLRYWVNALLAIQIVKLARPLQITANLVEVVNFSQE
jgi:hypothetical protein